jgi:hypothetical protein
LAEEQRRSLTRRRVHSGARGGSLEQGQVTARPRGGALVSLLRAPHVDDTDRTGYASKQSLREI